MKHFIGAILLIVWMISTIVLIVTLVGFFIILDADSGWSKIPEKIFVYLKE